MKLVSILTILILLTGCGGCSTTSPDILTDVKRDTVKHLRNQCMDRATYGWRPPPATRVVLYERCHLWAVRTVGL